MTTGSTRYRPRRGFWTRRTTAIVTSTSFTVVRQSTTSSSKLKVGSDTPLYAAMEVLQYGLLYVFSRQYRDELHYTDDRPLLKARRIDLKVLAPAAYYGEYRIDWLVRALNRGLEALVTHTGTPIEMRLSLEILTDLLERHRLGAIGTATSKRTSGG